MKLFASNHLMNTSVEFVDEHDRSSRSRVITKRVIFAWGPPRDFFSKIFFSILNMQKTFSNRTFNSKILSQRMFPLFSSLSVSFESLNLKNIAWRNFCAFWTDFLPLDFKWRNVLRVVLHPLCRVEIGYFVPILLHTLHWLSFIRNRSQKNRLWPNFFENFWNFFFSILNMSKMCSNKTFDSKTLSWRKFSFFSCLSVSIESPNLKKIAFREIFSKQFDENQFCRQLF